LKLLLLPGYNLNSLVSLENFQHPDIKPADWQDTLDFEFRQLLSRLVNIHDLRNDESCADTLIRRNGEEISCEQYLNQLEEKVREEIRLRIDCQQTADQINDCLNSFTGEDDPVFRFEQKD
jgi:hypothetical protein